MLEQISEDLIYHHLNQRKKYSQSYLHRCKMMTEKKFQQHQQNLKYALSTKCLMFLYDNLIMKILTREKQTVL